MILSGIFRMVGMGVKDPLAESLESRVDPSPVAIEDFPDLFSGCSTWNFQMEGPAHPFRSGLKRESISCG